MPFKFKDLLVNVLPGGQGAGRANAGCPTISVEAAGQARTCPTISVDPAQAAQTCPTISVIGAQMGACGGTFCPTISVIQQAAVCGGGSFCPTISVYPGMLCPGPSATPWTAGYTPQTAVGGCPTLTVPPTAMAGGGGAADLASLKQQLQQALAQVEEQERALQPGLPRTLAEAEDLERRLVEAVEELREHKKTLPKGEPSPRRKPAPAKKPAK